MKFLSPHGIINLAQGPEASDKWCKESWYLIPGQVSVDECGCSNFRLHLLLQSFWRSWLKGYAEFLRMKSTGEIECILWTIMYFWQCLHWLSALCLKGIFRKRWRLQKWRIQSYGCYVTSVYPTVKPERDIEKAHPALQSGMGSYMIAAKYSN